MKKILLFAVLLTLSTISVAFPASTNEASSSSSALNTSTATAPGHVTSSSYFTVSPQQEQGAASAYPGAGLQQGQPSAQQLLPKVQGSGRPAPGTTAQPQVLEGDAGAAKDVEGQQRGEDKRSEPVGPSALERAMGEAPVTAESSVPQPYGVGQLAQFGYNFFRTDADPLAAQTDVPVGPDYVLGPGDRLLLTLWGSIDGVFEVEVNRSGEIVLPKVGAVKVAGQRYGELPALLKSTLSRIFKDFQLNVNMGKLRSVKV